MSTEATVAGAPGYPLRYDVEYAEELSRWLIFVKWLLAIPHFIILYALGIASAVITFIAFFAILFTCLLRAVPGRVSSLLLGAGAVRGYV